RTPSARQGRSRRPACALDRRHPAQCRVDGGADRSGAGPQHALADARAADAFRQPALATGAASLSTVCATAFRQRPHMTDAWLWLSLFILLAYTIEAVTGFGSIVIALALGALLLPIPELLPVLVPLNICMSGYLGWRHRRHIQWGLLLKLILPLMLLGTLLGHGLRPWLGEALLRQGFGALVVWFATRELWRLWRGVQAQPHPSLLSRALTLGAGLTHGLFASGGPLLVY